MQRWGTRYETRGEQLVRVLDRGGCEAASFTWVDGALARLEVPGAFVDGTVITDPLLGPAHRLSGTQMSALDWSSPTEIPVIAAPAKLPPGSAAPLMNAIAILAARAGIPALRYAGPYPTAALWRTLLRSFTTTGREDDFSADALGRAARLARDPIAIDFVPDPHERITHARGHVELRATLERAVIDGVAYGSDTTPARLVADDDSVRAEVWFGDAPYAHVATFGADGALLVVHPLPACTSSVVGTQLPPALCSALAELVADAVPAPLASAARLVLERPIVWADLGARAAHATPAAFEIHAALWQRLSPQGMARVALAIVEALVPVVATAAAATLSP